MKTCRRVLSGFVCMLIVLMSTASSCTTTARRDAALTIYYNGDAVACEDGNQVEAGIRSDGEKDTHINKVLPIIYEDEVYVPLYTGSRMLGLELKYDDATKTIRTTNRTIDKYVAVATEHPENGTVRRPLFADTQKSQDVNVTTISGVTFVGANGSSKKLASASEVKSVQVDKPIELLEYKEVTYVNLEQLCGYTGMYYAPNELLRGIDVMSSTFKASLDAYLNTDDTRIECVYTEARGLRNWIYTNVFQESPSNSYRFTISKTESGKCWCVIDREQFNLFKTRAGENTKQLQEIVDGLGLEGKTDKEKVGHILLYVYDTYVYDEEASGTTKGRTVYSLLNDDKHVVCEGFARMFYMLCRQAGVQCQYLVGYVNLNGDGPILHAWNRVYIDDTWLSVDPTIGATALSLRGKVTLVSEAKMMEQHQEGTYKVAF